MANTFLGETRPAQISIRSNGGIPIIDESYNFLVQAESKDTSRISVVSTPELPLVNVTVSSYGLSVCKSKQATRRPDRADYWDVTCEFSSEVDERQSGQDPEGTDPNAWVPVYETKFERLQEHVTKDMNDDAVANSAGQPFETGIIRARYIPVWEFFQFESALITDEQIIERNEVVNSATFLGRPAKTLLCTVLSSVIGYYYGARRRLTQYSLKYNSQTWMHKRLDVGTVHIEGGVYKPYLVDGSVILGGLDGSGAKVATGSKPAVLEFDMFAPVNFSTFLRV
jgi:hypothetical protein